MTDIDAVALERWWAKELSAFWGDSARPVTLDTRRAAKVALNTIIALEASRAWYRADAAAALASAQPAQAGDRAEFCKALDERALAARAEKTATALSDALHFEEAASAIRTLEARVLSLETRLAAMGEALKGLTRDCLANDFNEHWDSFKNARAILSTEASHER